MFKIVASIFSFFILSIFVFLLFVYSEIRFDIDKIINYKPKISTRFFDKNHELIANIFDNEHRIYTKYEEIPPRVIEALLAIEDTNFFEHPGVNIDAIFRAIAKDIKHGKLVEGASTLTQQLVKTMVLTREKKLMRKIKEVLLSLRLETILTKEEILERYLNQVFFGHGYYGIRTASLGYFKKELSELSLKEIAILVGLPRAPSFYDPTRNLKFSLARANQVVRRMYKLGWINTQEYKDAMKDTPQIYNESLSQNKAPYVVDYALKVLKRDMKDIKYGGYKIDLTIDLKTQELSEKALLYGYEKIKIRDASHEDNISMSETLNGALITLENQSGKILSLVGGINYQESSFNRAVQSKRQPGSSIKPFLYQVGLNLGYSPASNLVDISRTYSYSKGDENRTWQPKNYEENFKGLITLREALVHSRNLATINLVTDIGIDILYKRLSFFGIEDMPFDLSITLGSFSISPIKLSEIYTIFSNNGIKVTPYIIENIENRYGQNITFDENEQYITSKEQAFLMTSILKDVVENGTGRRARVYGLETAGKTGTTNNNVDAWYCGYTPTLQTIIWYGNDDNKPMRKSETGGRSAGSVFKYFYTNYLKIHPEIKREFDIPEGIKSSFINGKKEYYSETSPLPEIQIKKSDDSTIIF